MSQATPEIPRSIYDIGFSRAGLAYKDDLALKNAYLYDQFGKFLTTTDLRVGQLDEAAERMQTGELVTVLPSHAGISWRPTWMERKRQRTSDKLGLNYLARNFIAIVSPCVVHLSGDDADQTTHKYLQGPYPTIGDESAKRLMQAAQFKAQSEQVFVTEHPDTIRARLQAI